MTLYSYWRSSAAYRVRIALNWKRLDYHTQPVHLLRDGGEQHQTWYRDLNPSELVPTLCDGDVVLNQSLAIIEYLDERYPSPNLLPRHAKDRALVRALALDISADLHPLNNLRVLNYLSEHFAGDKHSKVEWYRHWVAVSFTALEQRLNQHGGQCCVGDEVTLADVCLVPQVYNAERFACPMDDYPKIREICQYLETLPAFELANPHAQVDAE